MISLLLISIVIILALIYLPSTYKKIIIFIISLLFFAIIPLIPFGAGHGGAIPSASTFFLFSSIIHLIFFSILLIGKLGQYKSGLFFRNNIISLLMFCVTLVIFIISYKNVYIENYIEDWEDINVPSPRHFFQNPATYDNPKYGDDKLIYSGKILDMHATFDNDSILFLSANTIYKSYGYYGYEEKPLINISEIDSPKYFIVDYGRGGDHNDIIVYDDKKYASYYKFSFKNYKPIYDKKQTKQINARNPYSRDKERDVLLSSGNRHEVVAKISKESKELHFPNKTSFKVKYKPRKALKIKDKVYVTYTDKQGLYLLSNVVTIDNKHIQKQVRILINKALEPKWKTPDDSIFSILEDMSIEYSTKEWNMPDVSSMNIDQKNFDKLRIFLMQEPNIDYEYEILTSANHATVVVTSKDRNGLKLIFKLTKETVDDFYIFNTQEQKILGNIPITDMAEDLNKSIIKFYEKEFERYAKAFIDANNTYDVFASRIKYGVSLQCMVQNVNIYGNDAYYYRESSMQKYANKLDKKNYIKNVEHLYSSETMYDFAIITSLENKLLNDTSQWMCKEKKSADSIYELFINNYIKIFIDKFEKSSSDIEKIKWYDELKNRHSSEVKYFEKQKILFETKKELKTIQKEKIRRERILKDLEKTRKYKTKFGEHLLEQEYYKKAIEEEPIWKSEENNMIIRIKVLTEKITTMGEAKNSSYKGFDGAKIAKDNEQVLAAKKKDNLARQKTYKEIKRINKVIDNNESSNNYVDELKSAIELDDMNLVQKLLDNGASMYVKPKNNSQSPLFYAIKKNNLKVIKLFIKNGADVNHLENKVSLLREALVYSNKTIMKLLLDSGADINIIDGYGRKLKEYLSGCIYQTNLQIRKKCIDYENLFEEYGYIETRNKIVKHIYNIAKTGKNINKSVNLYGRSMSPLEISEYYLYDNDLTDRLLKKGASPHVSYYKYFHYRTSFGLNSFLDAALNKKHDKLKRYLSYGVSPNYRHNGGITSLMKFIKIGQCDRIESMKNLLDNGADPSLLDDNGYSLKDGMAEYCKKGSKKYNAMIELLKKYDTNSTIDNKN